MNQQIQDLLQNAALDDLEQGYWVDINQALPPGRISPDIELLKRDLPEDIRSGLNWSPDKQFFFLVSVLSPMTMPAMPADEPDYDNPDGENGTDQKPELDESMSTLLEMRDKEAVVLVEARNSVVAAWLWRKYAAETRLAPNEIYIAACCVLIPAE